MSAKVLKLAVPVVPESLTQIFNKLLVPHVFPTEWKVAQVNALHKRGPLNILDNYRPIVGKVFEGI